MTSSLSDFQCMIIDEKGAYIGKLEAGRFTVQEGRDRKVAENFPTSTVVEIINVKVGNQF